MKIPRLNMLKNKRVLIGISIIVVVTVIVSIIRISSGSHDVALYTVSRGEFLIDVRTSGEIEAAKSVTVSVPTNIYGNVRIVSLVEDGTVVKEGDFLIQFDTSEASERLKDRQNNLDNANAELVRLKADIESTTQELENNYLTMKYSFEQEKLRMELMKYEAESKRREQELEFKKAELSLQQAKEKIESQKIINQADIRKAELEVKQEEAYLKREQQRLDALTLTAPKGGMVVLQKSECRGEYMRSRKLARHHTGAWNW